MVVRRRTSLDRGRGVADEEQARHHAGGERAEQDVEVELGRRPHEQHAQQHADAHAELAARVERARDQLDRAGPGRPGRQPHRRSRRRRRTTSRTTVVRPGRSVVRASEMAMIGPISPIAPLARMFVPSLLSRMPASPRIGSSVPIAVVVRATATNRTPDVTPSACRRGGDADGEHERDHPAGHGEADRAALDDVGVDLEAGEEDEEDEPHLGEEVDDVVDLEPPEHVGTEEDAETDLDDDAREAASTAWRSRR